MVAGWDTAVGGVEIAAFAYIYFEQARRSLKPRLKRFIGLVLFELIKTLRTGHVAQSGLIF